MNKELLLQTIIVVTLLMNQITIIGLCFLYERMEKNINKIVEKIKNDERRF